jgi:hypothetical protein
VMIAFISYSSTSLYLKTSRWSIPRNPHLNPEPNAALDS